MTPARWPGAHAGQAGAKVGLGGRSPGERHLVDLMECLREEMKRM